MTRCCILLAGLVLLGSGTAALADRTLTYKTADGAPASVYYFKGDRLRIDPAGSGHSTIFDAANDTLTLLDHEDRRYSVITPATSEQLRQQVDKAQQQMSEAMRQSLSRLPPDQRKAIMKRIQQGQHAGQGALTKAMKVHVHRTGTTHTVNGYRCEEIVSRINTHSSHVCMASSDEVGLSAKAAATLTALGESVRRMAGGLLRGLGASMPALPGIDGIPVRIRNDQDETRLLDTVDAEAIPQKRFEVPADYKRQSLRPGGDTSN